MDLVDRDEPLQTLSTLLCTAARSGGQIALVAGEAGIGKTSLLKALAAGAGEAVVWWGACDALQTPHPLAPLQDIARNADVGFRSLLGADGNRAALFEAVLTELQQSRSPTLVVIEDAHWADDATLDLLKFLGRRIDRMACLLVISYRDDEVTPAHPLQGLFGHLPAGRMTRVDLPRLTPQAVELLARRALRSPAGIHQATQGNPFFVTELLRHGADGVPRSVHDLVLARFARLSPAGRQLVQLVSVAPTRMERRLVEKLRAIDVALEDECLNSGLLTATASELRFRHELARVAVEISLSEATARALHAAVLDALVRDNDSPVSLARLVHHAVRAGDGAAVRTHAPLAAREARQRGAHREAAAHYRAVLEHGSGVAGAERAGWLDAYARECQLTDRVGDAISARLELAGLYRGAANVMGEAENLSQLALAYVLALRNSEADAASGQAIRLLEGAPEGVQLANAYRVEAQLRMLNRDCEAAVAWSTKAMALAERFDDREILASAASTLGTAMMFLDYDAGCAQLQRALALASAEGLHHIAAVTYSNLGSGSGELFRLGEAQRYLEQTITFARAHEIDFYGNYAMAWLALCEMYQGRWTDAVEHALVIVRRNNERTTSRVMALVALGRVRARRGDPGADDVLDEALELALASNTLQRVAPVRAARAEAAWLRGDLPLAAREAQSALPLAASHRHPWFVGELEYWMARAGVPAAASACCAQPFALQMAGHWREAAHAWQQLGCPYERARALGEGDGAAQIAALGLFESLGARPAVEQLRQRLRAARQPGVPRGARPATRANPHGLTAREVEVLRLLCEGLKNAEIAERLSRSIRTVDHHLEAAFAKLGVASRTEAVAAALREGITSQNGRSGAPI